LIAGLYFTNDGFLQDMDVGIGLAVFGGIVLIIGTIYYGRQLAELNQRQKILAKKY